MRIISSIHLSTTLHKRFFHSTYARQILPQYHRNTYLCCFHYDRSLLCYEFPESTPLDKYLKNKKIVLNLGTILVVAVDLIDAIQCLENRGIVHNNITTSTVLIAKGFRVSNKCLDVFFFTFFFFSLMKSNFCNLFVTQAILFTLFLAFLLLLGWPHK